MRFFATWLSLAPFLLTACASCSSSNSGKGFDAGSSSGGGSGGGSSGGNGGGGDSGGVSPTQACADYAKAVCTQYSTCTPFQITTAYGDETTCEQRVALACLPSIGAAGSMVSAADIESCAQATQGDTCAELLDNSQPSACALTGTVANGAACGTDAQCTSGYCRPALASTCGTCAARAQAGQAGPDGGPACITDKDCSATLLCGMGRCVAPGASGAACSPSQPCSHTLACLASTGKCGTPLALGAPCKAVTDCDGAHGLLCDTVTTKKCVQIGSAMVGGACGIINKGAIECTASASCGNVTMGMGTCHQPAADNAPCGPDIACMAPAVCTTQAKCMLPNPSGCH